MFKKKIYNILLVSGFCIIIDLIAILIAIYFHILDIFIAGILTLLLYIFLNLKNIEHNTKNKWI